MVPGDRIDGQAPVRRSDGSSMGVRRMSSDPASWHVSVHDGRMRSPRAEHGLRRGGVGDGRGRP
eukprot:8472538-Pyramimonas_sp.AAC.1